MINVKTVTTWNYTQMRNVQIVVENIMNKLQQVVAVEMFTAVQAEVEKQLEPLKKNLGGLGGNNMNMNIN